ncbi:MAG: Eco57I restriction-modification methylase domain-containing protein [Solirubrobacteraceae bacterium]
MPLFQNSVVTKYLNTQDKNTLTHKWDLYKNLFLNPTKQNNIRNSKEEQYQEGFLRELFVQILGYTINPDLNFNLTTELKNEKDSKKADGGIIVDGKVFGVIELKGTNTTDLNKIETQAFGYKNNQKDCVYVITSNFEKLRFYIDNAIEHIEFNLFTLTEDEFQLLYLCLGFDNLSQNIAKRIKEESLSEEDMITKKLYKDYSLFKRELYQNLVLLNPDFQPLELFKKSQKLLDRFLFLFFAEDRQLLPPNSVRLILNQWKQIQELDLDEDVQLYSRFKKYFGYLNTGHKGKQHDVFAYNGGLFKPDEILDVIQIDDDLLYKHTLKLSEYDFASEVDVNILGHIFENSLNELDEIKAQLDPTREYDPLPKNQTKRKKDGVFYTPKYITKYIVENTLGKLCTEKKQEIEIIEEDYYLTREHAPLPKQTSLSKKKKQELLEKLTQYRNWLLQLTICDPACGSGAFLNEALNFLIAEHSYIDELQAKLFGDALVLSDVENSILENNLFGVDINEESVEIAKLSLWLRTAQPNRKLNDLTGNIKCGNSLIDDEAVAGEKAFNWQKEFPTVFKEKHKKPFHITWVTHNSRISQRMIDNKVKLSEAYWLEDEQEIMVAQTIKEIVEQDELNVMAFNICGDHIHILLVCEEEEIPNIIRKLKGKSSQKLKEYLQIPKEEQFTLWTQKYSTTYIDSEDQLWNTVEYIRNNRRKHGLDTSNKGQLPLASHSDSKLPLASSSIGSINKGLQPLVAVTTSSSLSQSYDHAFRTEYKGGFDVVIGNPPYVQIQSMGNVSNDLEKSNFQTFEKTGDLYCLFYELGNIVLNNNGLLGFITSNKWLRANYGKSLRNYLIKNTQPLELLDLGSGIFESATVDSNLLIFKKTKK